jgi:hypothetical protein
LGGFGKEIPLMAGFTEFLILVNLKNNEKQKEPGAG